ncbi:hypothetical protein [Pseudoalteromonas piscicida]|uniref:DUF3078 domain-containing protein n=1 Tax=Pseudoalteromonas piscicida TaxID=43662 RepID=A0AAD0W4T7_PSEO7|nr:hypothetical protein [Pseudoalteromonas piscicida]ASD68712.1 hypothetical protein B1L02_17930 [Pseudoalteromonas piscicida]AXR03770.1 hypothetical protein D0511_18010 [Pseudoalteromonas piscicida]
MKTLITISTISLILFSNISQAEDPVRKTDVITDKGKQKVSVVDESNTPVELDQSDRNAITTYEWILNIASVSNIPDELVTQSAEFVNYLLLKKTIDTDLLYNYVLTLDANLSQLPDKKFVSRMRELTSDLRASSYADEIHYNTNLSYQLRTRMPIIVKASLLLNDTNASDEQLNYRKEDFEKELRLFTDKYISTSRFKAGLGFSYAYTPKINYRANNVLDLSPFTPDAVGGVNKASFTQSFANSSFPSFEVAAKMPWVELGISVPVSSEDSSITTPVQFVKLDDTSDREAAFRTTLESTIKMEYDFSFRLPLLGGYKKLRFSNPRNSQMDWGLLLGLTGFKIEDEFTTDLRFRTDNTPFNELSAGTSFSTSRSLNFQTIYYGAYYEFEFVDELYMTIDVKWHKNQSEGDNQIDVDGFTTSLRIIYAPTIDFIN